MTHFDPKKAREQSKNAGVPPNDYLIAATKIERKMSKNDKPYLWVWFVIIAGAARGKKFRDIVSLDTSNEGTAFRLALLMEAVGREEVVDLGDERELAHVIVGKPFKARIRRTYEGEYVNNGIERYLLGKDVTDADRDAMEQYRLDREVSGHDDASDDNRDVPPPTDDDCPF